MLFTRGRRIFGTDLGELIAELRPTLEHLETEMLPSNSTSLSVMSDSCVERPVCQLRHALLGRNGDLVLASGAPEGSDRTRGTWWAVANDKCRITVIAIRVSADVLLLLGDERWQAKQLTSSTRANGLRGSDLYAIDLGHCWVE